MILFDVYPLFDVNITRGKGCKVWDDNGTEYLDLYGGHAVISVGHSNDYYVEALKNQAEKLCFYSNSVINTIQKDLATKLGRVSGYDDYSLFLINSGAEANENAMKLASFHTGRKRIIALEKAFHGRTSAAVDVTDNEALKAPINRSGNVTFVAINDLEALQRELEKNDVAAVIIEAIQGVGGIRLATKEYYTEAIRLCHKYGSVFIADEVQTGYGRTGKFFAHQWFDVRPDLITVAKGMGNGFPVGGVLISPKFKAKHGQLGTTFGGNHLACTAACAVLDIIERESLVDNAEKIGNLLMSKLKEMNFFKDVRGKGLMIGMESDIDLSVLRRRLIYDSHVFTGASGKNIIRLLPPLVLTEQEVNLFIERMKSQIEKL